jgi:hypothetical protein
MTVEVRLEQDLYEPTRRFLKLVFPGLLKARSAEAQLEVFSDEVSRAIDGVAGRWTRPDLAALVVLRGEYVPYWRADLHTFEVKTAAGLDETSVHEAHAHGRFGQYAWLVFQSVGNASETSASGVWHRVERQCAHLGVGLICFEDTTNANAWRVVHWPKRTGTDGAMSDRFVKQRFSDQLKREISLYLTNLGWRI